MRLLLIILCLSVFMTANAEKITIYAAASTTNAIDEIKADFTTQTGHDVVGSYASSGTLAKQIMNSAPADIFISANVKWMKTLAEKGYIAEGTDKPLLANRLALVANVSSKQEAVELTDAKAKELINAADRIAIGDPAHVPAGGYAQKTMEALGIWDASLKKAVRMQSVRVALATVERNAVPLGIVYSSDAAQSDRVKIVGLFNEELHGPIRYPYGIVKGKDSDAVKAFYEFLKSDKASQIFEKYGFKVVK